jgi:molybdopterin-guanine dinucleotide biosynthesis protein A
MPLVRTELLQGLLGSRGSTDAILPRIDGQLQPFPGLYSSSCIDAIGALLTVGRSAARDLAEVCRVTFVEEEALRKLDPDLSSFRDLDTPSDFEEMKATGSVRGPL